MANGFTAKQQRFIEEYVKCLNATKAAKRAGYSPKTAYSIGQENLTKPEIKEEIERIIKKNVISPDEVLQELVSMALFDVDDMYDFVGGLPVFNPDKARDNNVLRLVSGIKSTDKEMTLKFPDKLKALELIAKYHGLFVEKHEHSGTVTVVKGYAQVSPDDWDGDGDS